MRHNYVVQNVDEALNVVGTMLLADGKDHDSRNGPVRRLQFVGITIERPLERYIRNPYRKANLAAQIVETMWVLSGRSDIAAIEPYLPRAADFSDDGKTWRAGYGPRIRCADNAYESVDPLWNVIEMLRKDPGTRRAVISIWNNEVDYGVSKDIPCNDWLHFLSDGEGNLDLHVAVRSNDFIWGWSGINQFEWSFLLEVVSRLTGMQVGKLHFSISDLHVYTERHLDRLTKVSQDQSWARCLVDFAVVSPNWGIHTSKESVEMVVEQWWAAEKAIRDGDPDRAALIHCFHGVFFEWLQVLEEYWNPSEEKFFISVCVHDAFKVSMKRKQDQKTSLADGETQLALHIVRTHEEKHAVYGNSWKKRGERISILPNIARKIDRLGVNGAGDTALDTALDLFVYCSKYRTWLWELNTEETRFPEFFGPRNPPPGSPSDATTVPNQIIADVLMRPDAWADYSRNTLSTYLEIDLVERAREVFEKLCSQVEDPSYEGGRYAICDMVDLLLGLSAELCKRYWSAR